ncbi:MAG: hypothetical protein HYV95_12495 [Opitutae bacterium]|nr:hypothetical protein [Opitutae bacterium]
MSIADTVRLHSEVDTPRPLRATHGRIKLTGWCLDEDQAAPPAVRLSVGGAVLAAQPSSTERADVRARFPKHPAAARCGFVIEGTVPAGVHLAQAEARTAGGVWQIFKRFTVAAEAVPFTTTLETPAATGTVRSRVLVTGWAVHPNQPIKALTLRYGHQEIPADPGRPRPDLAQLFPGAPQAASAGFTGRTILSAGRGLLRIKARLADGSVALARTGLEVNIATDENYGPEFDWSAPRIPLPTPAARPAEPLPRAARPLNTLFILHGSFAANSALHVAALANELAAAGHDCAVAVPHDPETLAHYVQPRFRGLTFAAAGQSTGFANGRGPDIIHAWTTRENVRRLTETLRARHHSRVIVHLEDNEPQLLALTLGRSMAELEQLPAAQLDALVPPDLSHPLRSREFLTRADGVTVILDRLREFVPADKPTTTLWPAADARYFFPREKPQEFRRILDTAPGTTTLFYHGNAHTANAAEMRELYLAVARLNEAGESVTLIRTGRDQVDFLGNEAARVRPHVLELGQILHHHHLPPLMALADIFVQPGGPDAFNDYRFPSKLPEFFALGRPVILPRTNLGTALHHGVDAYVLERADAAGIAGAVTALRRDRALAERLGAGAAAFATKRFSWRRSAAALAAFYQSLLPA